MSFVIQILLFFGSGLSLLMVAQAKPLGCLRVDVFHLPNFVSFGHCPVIWLVIVTKPLGLETKEYLIRGIREILGFI